MSLALAGLDSQPEPRLSREKQIINLNHIEIT